MMLFERTMKDIEAACKKLGWVAREREDIPGDVSGMVIGTEDYVNGVWGALVGAALHGIGGGLCEEDTHEDQPVDKVCAPGSGESEAGQDGATEGTCTPLECAIPSEQIRTYGGTGAWRDKARTFLEEHPAPFMPDSPEAQKSKVAGRILGAVNGKPVGMLSQVPEEG